MDAPTPEAPDNVGARRTSKTGGSDRRVSDVSQGARRTSVDSSLAVEVDEALTEEPTRRQSNVAASGTKRTSISRTAGTTPVEFSQPAGATRWGPYKRESRVELRCAACGSTVAAVGICRTCDMRIANESMEEFYKQGGAPSFVQHHPFLGVRMRIPHTRESKAQEVLSLQGFSPTESPRTQRLFGASIFSQAEFSSSPASGSNMSPGAAQLFYDDFEDSGSDGQAADLFESLGRGNKGLGTLMEYATGSDEDSGSETFQMEDPSPEPENENVTEYGFEKFQAPDNDSPVAVQERLLRPSELGISGRASLHVPRLSNSAKLGLSEFGFDETAGSEGGDSGGELGTLQEALKPEASTFLSMPVAAGAVKLEVATIIGFKLGRQIVIDPGKNQEVCEIADFGSIILKTPLKMAHPAGISVIMYKEPGAESDDKEFLEGSEGSGSDVDLDADGNRRVSELGELPVFNSPSPRKSRKSRSSTRGSSQDLVGRARAPSELGALPERDIDRFTGQAMPTKVQQALLMAMPSKANPASKWAAIKAGDWQNLDLGELFADTATSTRRTEFLELTQEVYEAEMPEVEEVEEELVNRFDSLCTVWDLAEAQAQKANRYDSLVKDALASVTRIKSALYAVECSGQSGDSLVIAQDLIGPDLQQLLSEAAALQAVAEQTASCRKTLSQRVKENASSITNLMRRQVEECRRVNALVREGCEEAWQEIDKMDAELKDLQQEASDIRSRNAEVKGQNFGPAGKASGSKSQREASMGLEGAHALLRAFATVLMPHMQEITAKKKPNGASEAVAFGFLEAAMEAVPQSIDKDEAESEPGAEPPPVSANRYRIDTHTTEETDPASPRFLNRLGDTF